MTDADDPFAWLASSSEEASQAILALDRAALTALRADPLYASVRCRLQDLLPESSRPLPQPCGTRWLRVEQRPGRPSLVELLAAPHADGRTVLDPAAVRATAVLAVTPTPDGSRFAAVVMSEGDQPFGIVVVDVPSGTVHADRINSAAPPAVAWRPDGRGFFYTTILSRSGLPGVKSHTLGDDPADGEELEIVGSFLNPHVSLDGRHVAVTSGVYDPQIQYVRDLVTGDTCYPFVPDVSGLFLGRLDGGHCVAIVQEAAPRGRVVSIPLTTAARRDTWETLVPESDVNLRWLDLTSERIVLGGIRDGSDTISVYGRDGAFAATVPMAGWAAAATSAVGGLPGVPMSFVDPERGTLTFNFIRHTASPALHQWSPGDHETRELVTPAISFDNFDVERLICESGDGTQVSGFIVHRSDRRPPTPSPVLLDPYGGFNLALVPRFVGPFAAFIDAGGAYVQPHVRGGGEYGLTWREQGQGAHKTNSFDDVCAIAEELIRLHWTTPDMLGITGMSNGGMVAAAACVRRPDLFRVLVPLMAPLDFVAAGEDPSASYWFPLDYGDVADEAVLSRIREYSPYRALRLSEEGRPAILACYGDEDTTVPPWTGAKLVRSLRDLGSPNEDVHLRVWSGTGHDRSGTRDRVIDQSAEWLSFAMSRLGMKIQPETLEG